MVSLNLSRGRLAGFNPDDLPDNVTELDISFNYIEVFHHGFSKLKLWKKSTLVKIEFKKFRRKSANLPR